MAGAPFFGGGLGDFSSLGMRVVGHLRVNVQIGGLHVFGFWSVQGGLGRRLFGIHRSGRLE